MNILRNRIVLYLLCTTFWISKSISGFTIILFLFTLLCGNLICLFHSRGLYLSCLFVFLLFSFIYTDLAFFYPYLMYEMLGKEKERKFILFILPCCAIIQWYPASFPFWLYSGSLFLISYQLQTNTRNRLYWEKKYWEACHENYERSYDLMEKNNALRQNQDYELHLATLKERNRIAREIHDNVGHLLSRSLLQTGALQVINQDENLKEPLNTLKQSLDTAMTSIRSSVHDLHDESIHLQTVLSDLQKENSDIPISLHYGFHSELPKEFKYAIIAITKEAITNTRRHSTATKISIHLTEHPAFYQLIIKDNGTSIPKDLLGGIGLENMKERVQQLGGQFRIITTDGFRIQAILWKGEQP